MFFYFIKYPPHTHPCYTWNLIYWIYLTIHPPTLKKEKISNDDDDDENDLNYWSIDSIGCVAIGLYIYIFYYSFWWSVLTNEQKKQHTSYYYIFEISHSFNIFFCLFICLFGYYISHHHHHFFFAYGDT